MYFLAVLSTVVPQGTLAPFLDLYDPGRLCVTGVQVRRLLLPLSLVAYDLWVESQEAIITEGARVLHDWEQERVEERAWLEHLWNRSLARSRSASGSS